MNFTKIAPFWVSTFGTSDISFGIHICWKGRIDIHFLWWMFSIGKVPIYRWNTRNGVKQFAVSNSFHETGKTPLRAGVPEPAIRRKPDTLKKFVFHCRATGAQRIEIEAPNIATARRTAEQKWHKDSCSRIEELETTSAA